MAGKPMGLAWAGWTRGGLALLAALALSACEDGLGTGTSGAAPAASDGSGTAPTDVAAPDVFHVTEAGLWDGRPSLGGIWVAHPDVTDPERVRIVNQSNGQEIIGALFRRERDLPGPALQVSSDAAEGLGMLAGAPATLDVTAIRRQEPPAPATPAVETTPAAAAPTTPATEAEPAAQAPAKQAPASQAPTAQAPAPAAAPAPRSGGGRGLFGGLFGRTPAAAPAAGAGAIATTPLDGGVPTDAAAPASPLQFPYVQLATLSTEAAATEAAQALAAKGLPARVASVPGQDAWRLLLGPVTTEAQQTALREQAVAEGFTDAYLVRS